MSSNPENSEIRFKFTHPETRIEAELIMRKMGQSRLLADVMNSGGEKTASTAALTDAVYRKTITGARFQPAVITVDECSEAEREQILADFLLEVGAFAPAGFSISPQENRSGKLDSHVYTFPNLDDKRFLIGNEPISFGPVANAWSVSESTRLFYDLWGGNLNAKRIVAAGWNDSLRFASYYLTKHNGFLTAFHHNGEWYMNGQGWTIEDLERFITTEELPERSKISEPEFFDQLHTSGAEVLLACDSARRNIQVSQALLQQGFEVYVDHPLRSCRSLPTYQKFLAELDQTTGLIPSFVSHSGLERMMYVLGSSEPYTQNIETILDLTGMIEAGLTKIHQFNVAPRGIRAKCIEIAEQMKAI